MAAVINRMGWGPGLRLWIVIGFLGLMACAGSPQLAGQGPISLAVWDLEDLSPMVHGQAGMGEILSGQIASRVAQNSSFQMVERQQLLKAIEELHVGSGKILKTASATAASADLNQWLSAADEAAVVLIAP